MQDWLKGRYDYKGVDLYRNPKGTVTYVQDVCKGRPVPVRRKIVVVAVDIVEHIDAHLIVRLGFLRSAGICLTVTNRASSDVSNLLARAIARVLSLAGYSLRKKEITRVPVEFEKPDNEIVSHVVAKRLSMCSHERLFTTLMACRHVCQSGIDGDFVECGVWRGGNSLIAADVFHRLAPEKKVYMFDTFSGMTEPTVEDKTNDGRMAFERYLKSQRQNYNEWCYASLEDVRRNFEARDLDINAIFVKGDVLQSLENEANVPAKISVLRLDTDWYESTRKELEVMYPRLQIGGILIVDDYGHWGGAKKAVDEFFASRPRPYLHYVDYTGRVGIKHA